jgi:hypothetical protein
MKHLLHKAHPPAQNLTPPHLTRLQQQQRSSGSFTNFWPYFSAIQNNSAVARKS